VSAVPDFTSPVVGYRAWRVEADGLLVPWTMASAAWVPGVNEGRCLASAGRGHTAPGHDCSCGLYALASHDDPRLEPLRHAVGSIAAWGEIEVHRTGFRAQYACVTALSFEVHPPSMHLACLRAAAHRYSVPLVRHSDLREYALAWGAPVDFALAPSRRCPAPTGPPLAAHGVRGISPEDHVWVEITGQGLQIGVTDQLAGEIAVASPVDTADAGRVVCAGEPLARIGAGESRLVVRVPFDLAVRDVNPSLLYDPDLVRTDPEVQGWLVRATPLDWDRQAGDVLWGRRGETIYRASVAEAARVEDPFGWQKPGWVAKRPPVSNAGDVLALLRAERNQPMFADESAVQKRIARGIETALGDPEVRRRAFRARVLLHLRLHRPDSDIDIDLGSRPAGADSPPNEEITIFTDAETADAFFAGRLDIAQALRSRCVQSRTPFGRILRVASIIKDLQQAYAELR
jgi:glycine cleavage system H lipoate-binding protein